MDIYIGIKLPVGDTSAKACIAVKKATNLSLGDIKEKALGDEWIFKCPIADDDGLRLINQLTEELASLGVTARLFEDGREESADSFKALERLHDEINQGHY